MSVLYRVAHGIEFDRNGFLITNYLFFDSLSQAEEYCQSVLEETGEVLSIVSTDMQFRDFYFKLL
jgi:hypothetical protein